MVELFLITVAAGLVVLVVPALVPGAPKQKSTFVILLTAVVCLFFATIWNALPSPSPGTFRDGLQRAANDFRWWFGVLAAIWLYQFVMNVLTAIRRNNEIVAVKNDVYAIANVIERAVMPRHVTRRQEVALVGFLKHFEGQHVSFKTVQGNSEVAMFRADLQQALTKAGWTIGPIEYGDVGEGLTLHFVQTIQSSQQPIDRAQPKSDELLRLALATAGIRMDGSGGSSGPSVTENRLIIQIGPASRDSYHVDPPPGMF